ncbi:MAG TPA: BlaI/MecI/CopY family transcriptional regulator [Rugosimonospora sp.]|nr:BlaI/MecI/CopY family transcriptional regulator [Rugosimonospora sp.]
MRGFGELETAVMLRMWERGAPATVRDLLTELRGQRDIAYTTVMTVMDNLHRKGWLDREPVGRAYRYTPVASREQYSAQLMGEALRDSGDRLAALTHFVGRMTLDEAAALREALTRYERRIAGR